MKLGTLIKKLNALDESLHKLEVVVDADEHGYYNLEKVKVIKTEDEKPVINLQSSNEA